MVEARDPVERTVERTVEETVYRAESAGESVFTDGDKVWLRYSDDRCMAADAETLLSRIESVQHGHAEYSRVGDVVVSSRVGSNPIYLAGYDTTEDELFDQNTNLEAVERAVEAARD